MSEYINLTPENIEDEHLCCIIRSKTKHPGVEAKRQWLKERITEGHVFRKLNEKATVFIEYAPLEKAWVPIIGENYTYLYCLWVESKYKGKGYGKELMEYAIEDAKRNGKSGLCMLASNKQKAWLSDQSFAKKFGFEVVDSTPLGYELLALSLDGTKPRFAENAKKEAIDPTNLTIYYDMQCPFIFERIDILKKECERYHIPADFIYIDSLKKSKQLPCVFNNWALFYNGFFQTVNQLDIKNIQKIIKKSH